MSLSSQMPPRRPTAAVILSIVAGVFDLVGGLTIWGIFSLVPDPLSSAIAVMGILGVVMGLVMIIGSMRAYSRPQSYDKWGILMVMFAFVSWVVAAGGIFVGFVLGLIGGILWVVWKPSPQAQQSYQSTLQRQPPAQAPPLIPSDNDCPYCGNPLAASDRNCPRCGRELDPPALQYC